MKQAIITLLGSAMLALAVLALLAVFIGSSLLCCTPQAASDLYGTYVADYDIAQEKLILRENGTFKQELTLKRTSQVSTTVGSWTYDSTRGDVTFDGFIVAIDVINPDYPSPTGPVVKPVWVRFGTPGLGVEEHILYKRVSTDT